MTSCADSNWGADDHRLLTLDEAWSLITAEARPLQPEKVSFEQAAGRVLASPVLASDDYPAFDKAMMDGFAVRASDCREPGASLHVLGLVAAGRVAQQSIGPSQTIQVNTGAPVPGGADAVVRVEDTTMSADGKRVTINVAVGPGKHIAPQGSDRKKHDLVLPPPMTLQAAQLAAAATAGASELEVYPEVTVAVATTGDELVPVGQSRKPGQIYESNSPMLAALMREFGASPYEIGRVRDEPTALKKALSEALHYPVVITVGGMSMGTHDLVPQAFVELGITWKFHGVLVRPGKPVAYGRGPDGQHVFGLPGNPVSAFVCAWLFVRMTVRALQGHPALPPTRLRATLTKTLMPARDPRPAFVPARVWNNEKAGLVAEPCAWGGSGDPFGLALANALMVRETPIGAVAGSPIDVILLSMP
ncbi:MAG: molybdopterin molybdotransferase MoeA [Phycisphaerales bacterium]|nr:molybdopterin molybdotransferase MoeA [Phycisphaerales bacterium]